MPFMLKTWKQRFLFVVGYFFTAIIFYLFCSLRHRGARYMPRSGPVILVANHQSFWDPMIVGLVAARPLSYIARKSLFKNQFFAWLMTQLGGRPIDQDGSATAGIKTAIQLLKEGHAVVIFPEGNRTEDGAIQEMKPGLSLVLKKAPAPVVPVGIAGAFEGWPRFQKYPRLAPIFLPPEPGCLGVVYGPPIPPERLLAMDQQEMMAFFKVELTKLWLEAEQLRRKP
jgi:1-acyl-sn-glycerol-3-phosphate acyltransferase